MAINKKSFLKTIIDKHTPVGAVKEAGKLAKTKFKIFKQDRDAVSRIMKKYYPDSTVVPNATYSKRAKEFRKLYKEKGPKEVIEKAKKYKKEWKKLNN